MRSPQTEIPEMMSEISNLLVARAFPLLTESEAGSMILI
jgi:hypothetical protein